MTGPLQRADLTRIGCAAPSAVVCAVVSNRAMASTQSTPHTTDQRLTELEIKASYADDLLDTLNAQVARQQEQIDLLLRDVSRLRQQGGDDGGTHAPSSPRDELPPHY